MNTPNIENLLIIKQAFIKACKYLQQNPPGNFLTWDMDEIGACMGAGSYDDGWHQWANYFIAQVQKEEEKNK